MKRLTMLSILMSAVLFQTTSFAWHNAAMVHDLPAPSIVQLSIAQTVPLNQPTADDCSIVEDGRGIGSTCSQVDCFTSHCSASPANVAILSNEELTPDHPFKLDGPFRRYEADRALPFRPPVSV